MSTIVVVRNENEAVIGADTLTSYGYSKIKAKYIKNKSKITKIGDSYIAASGNAVIPLILNHYFNKPKIEAQFNSVEEIFVNFLNIHKELKDGYFLNPNENEDDSFESSQLTCLIANKTGIYGVDQFRYVEEYTTFSAYGSGKEYSIGAMKVAYEQGLPIDEVAKLGLEAASEFDEATEGPFDIIKIVLK